MTDTSTDPVLGNVIEALAWVTARMGGIAKTRPDRADGEERGILYAYRGIDAIAAAAQPLLGRARVVIVPTDTHTAHHDKITVNGRAWTDTTVEVDWTVYGPGGVTDQITATTIGIGRDNSDKGYNKAQTQAYKNLLLRLLCIGDPQDDGDQPHGQNLDTDQPHGQNLDTDPPPATVSTAQAKDRLLDLVNGDRDLAKRVWGSLKLKAGPYTTDQVDAIPRRRTRRSHHDGRHPSTVRRADRRP
jgi:hypothetical protein